MFLAKDKRLHLIGGIAILFYLLVVLWVQHNWGTGWALIIGGVLAGLGIEAYQHVRKEGTADPWDALASAAVCIAAGIVVLAFPQLAIA